MHVIVAQNSKYLEKINDVLCSYVLLKQKTAIMTFSPKLSNLKVQMKLFCYPSQFTDRIL